MTTFVLIHGGAHGPWCWDRVRPLLESKGHRVIAPTLPVDEPSAGLEEWARAVLEAIPPTDSSCVLVGHSMGGFTLPLVASNCAVRKMIFLAAVVPIPGGVFAEYLAVHPDAIVFPSEGRAVDDLGRSTYSYELAKRAFYNDATDEQARWAFRQLRPQTQGVWQERYPIDEWPDVPSSYIAAENDRTVGFDWGVRFSEEFLKRPARIIGGGHSPFLVRPQELTKLLIEESET